MNQEELLSTDIFRMSHGRFLKITLWRHSGLFTLLAAALIVVAIALSFFLSDWRYAVAALLILLLLVPMVLAFVYLFYGLHRNAYFNVTDHRLVFRNDGVQIKMYFKNRNELTEDKWCEWNERGEKQSAERRTDDATNTNRSNTHVDDMPDKIVDFMIDYSCLDRYYIMGDSVFYPMKSDDVGGLLWLPAGAFGNDSSFSMALNIIKNKGKYHEDTKG